jgi:hypothetical protein
MLRPTSAAPVAACLLSLVTACSTGGAGGGAPSGYTKIDDMEGQSGFVEWTPPSGTPGHWWTATDCTEADRILPPPFTLNSNDWTYAELPSPEETFPGITSTHAARLRSTSPLVGIWGANMAIDFGYGTGPDGTGVTPPSDDGGAPASGQPCQPQTSRTLPGLPVDLSAYSGVTFWGMSGGAPLNIQVTLSDLNSDPRGGVCNGRDPNVETNCYNHFGAGVILTSSMTRYTVDFASLTQNPYWGYHPSPDVPDLQHVYTLIFEFDTLSCQPTTSSMCAGGAMPPASFDFWIDDVYLVNR